MQICTRSTDQLKSTTCNSKTNWWLLVEVAQINRSVLNHIKTARSFQNELPRLVKTDSKIHMKLPSLSKSWGFSSRRAFHFGRVFRGKMEMKRLINPERKTDIFRTSVTFLWFFLKNILHYCRKFATVIRCHKGSVSNYVLERRNSQDYLQINRQSV